MGRYGAIWLVNSALELGWDRVTEAGAMRQMERSAKMSNEKKRKKER